MLGLEETDWKCSQCHYTNFGRREACKHCETSRYQVGSVQASKQKVNHRESVRVGFVFFSSFLQFSLY
jgi:hypothetical protein